MISLDFNLMLTILYFGIMIIYVNQPENKYIVNYPSLDQNKINVGPKCFRLSKNEIICT